MVRHIMTFVPILSLLRLNPYGSISCIRFEGMISAPRWEHPFDVLRCKGTKNNWNLINKYDEIIHILHKSIWQNDSKSASLLTLQFWENPSESLKMPLTFIFPHFDPKYAQIKSALTINTLCSLILKSKFIIDVCTLQNRSFLRVFAHFLALTKSKHSTLKFQTRRVVLLIRTCRVVKRALFLCQTSRFSAQKKPLFAVC